MELTPLDTPIDFAFSPPLIDNDVLLLVPARVNKVKIFSGFDYIIKRIPTLVLGST